MLAGVEDPRRTEDLVGSEEIQSVYLTDALQYRPM
jgi:hypothetical protein